MTMPRSYLLLIMTGFLIGALFASMLFSFSKSSQTEKKIESAYRKGITDTVEAIVRIRQQTGVSTNKQDL